MTRIGSKNESPISLSRIRGEAGGLAQTSRLSVNQISNFASVELYPRIDDFDQVMQAFTIGSDRKFSEFEFMDANPGYYFITDGDAISPTSLDDQGNGFFETDDGNQLVTDTESGSPSVVNSIFINTSTLYNVNLKSILFSIRGDTTEPEGLIFLNRGNIFSKRASSPALSTGSGWINGSRISIINEGSIMGAGGQGGSASFIDTNVDGSDGGDAISINYDIHIQNQGEIFAGGGGGSGSTLSGGGGGAGSVGGPGGNGNSIGSTGGSSSGGDGGAYTSPDTSIAMPGGGLARVGVGSLGTGGSPGMLLRKNGFNVDSVSLFDGFFLSSKLKGVIQ